MGLVTYFQETTVFQDRINIWLCLTQHINLRHDETRKLETEPRQGVQVSKLSQF